MSPPRAAGVTLVLMFMATALPSHAADDPLARARALYNQNEVPESIPHFEEAARDRPNDSQVQAWLAEAYRRVGDHDKAEIAARKSLRLDPCNSSAHATLADNCNPQFGEWWGANRDTAWSHMLLATACDATDGDAWFSLVHEAMRRSERGIERTALRELVNSGFLKPATLAFGRWLLATLPDSAILIVNGDMDTFPPLALQEIEALRRDVAVINISMLENDWYRFQVMVRHQLRSPFDRDQLIALSPLPGPGGTSITPAQRLVAAWCSMVETGSLKRPLAVAVTVPRESFPGDIESRMKLCGSFWSIEADTVGMPIDTVTARKGLVVLKGKDFVGPWTSDRDRSPIRRMGTPSLANNCLYSASMLYNATRYAGRKRDAARVHQWAMAFARAAAVDSILQVTVRDWPAEYDRMVSGKSR